MRIGSLFSGIGGLELGLEWAGVGHTVWQVECDPFCRSVLAKHWPDVRRYEDVRSVGAANLAPVDLVCGGFPCVDTSTANPRGAGLHGDQGGLWFEFERIVRELAPPFVVVENTGGNSSRWVPGVGCGLERLGYQTLPVQLEARDLGADHARSRVFVVAYPNGVSLRDVEQRSALRFKGTVCAARKAQRLDVAPWPPRSEMVRATDGLPRVVDRNRALGNSAVPQCAEVVGHVINEFRGAG